MRSVTSTDGTEIAFERTGDGPPVVLVHGTTGHRLDWREVVPALSEDYTVYAIDRRGRGESGDAADYAIEREYEDVAEVVDRAASEHPDDPVSLVGHSYGAICSLHAVLETDAVDRLVLYEPPLGDVPEPEGVAADLEGVIEAEGAEAAAEVFLRNAAGMTEEEIELMRGDELWDRRIEAMPTVPREIRATRRDLFDPAAFSGVSVDATLLVGGDSPEPMQEATELVADALDGSSVVPLDGQEHMAIHEAPDDFLDALVDALEGRAD